jgi:hypothetical protein
MDPRAFAAQRADRLKAADATLRPFVAQGLNEYRQGDADWTDVIVDAAAQIWLENYQAEAPGRPYSRPLAAFRTRLADNLDRTAEPSDPVDPSQTDRITRWLSTYATNAGTTTGAFGRGIQYKRWTTMHDDHVRESHELLDGEVRRLGGTFMVNGNKLGYPGEPVGPPENWINCRCVLMPASRDGEAMSATTYVMGPEETVEIDNPDIITSDDVYVIQRDWAGGTNYYGPFPSRELADAWTSAGGAGDGEYGTIPLAAVQGTAIVAAATDPADIDTEPIDMVDAPEDDEELITEIPVHGVLAPEGVPTGDGRMFALESLSTRDLPVPLLYEYVHSHGGDTSMTSTVGRVDEAWRDEATNMWRWRGAIVLSTQYGQEAIDGMVNGMVRGVSIDGDDAEVQMVEPEEGAEGDALMEILMGAGETVFAKMRVSGLTIVPIPAFQEAYIALGHEFQEDLTDAEVDAEMAALQACGCLDGWGVIDLTESTEDTATAALEAAFRDFPQEERDKAADQGHALPDGSFPIENCEDLQNAIQAIGRAKDPDAAKAHIRKRFGQLDCPGVELPEDWAVAQAFAVGTKDGPGWITHPIPTARIRRYWTRGKGAAKIKWGLPGDFNRCRAQLAKYVQNPDWLAGLCANMHYEALGIWPAQHHGARVLTAAASPLRSPAARLEPQAATEYPASWFQNPQLGRPVPLRIEKDTRRIFGYAAEWGVCHVGIEGFCQEVPASGSDYGYFKKGLIDTDQGEQPVGVISYGEGHASPYARIAAATAHYDQPHAVRAYVNLGEDEFGIWFAGVLAPWVTDEDIAAMRAIGAVSGDWREIRGNYELIGIPVVNTPGYPVLAASAGKQISMIGVGALQPEPDAVELEFVSNDDLIQRAVSQAVRQTKLANRAAGARAAVRKEALAAARARIERSTHVQLQ